MMILKGNGLPNHGKWGQIKLEVGIPSSPQLALNILKSGWVKKPHIKNCWLKTGLSSLKMDLVCPEKSITNSRENKRDNVQTTGGRTIYLVIIRREMMS